MSGMQKIYENFVFNELIEYTDEEGLTPELATEWAASEGGKVWTFKLRDDVTFHNGEHFTSDDVLFTYERAVEKGVATATWVNQIEAVECPDDYTVVFTLIAPNMDFDFLCSSKYTGILNREACEADPDKGYAIGTSGFMLDEFEANDHFTVVRFDDSWVWAEKGLTPTEKVVISYYTDNNAKAIAVQAGDIDIAAVINANEAPTLDALDNITVMMNPHPVLIATLFSRLKEASEAGRPFSMILGNPEPDTYIPLAQLINYFGVDCRKVHIFAEDEWADDQGNVAPETYEAGFVHSLIKYFVMQIDPKLRMPMANVHFQSLFHFPLSTPDAPVSGRA